LRSTPGCWWNESAVESLRLRGRHPSRHRRRHGPLHRGAGRMTTGNWSSSSRAVQRQPSPKPSSGKCRAGVRVCCPRKARALSRARNAAVRVADGDVIAMTDDDCEAAPDWLAVLVDRFASLPQAASSVARSSRHPHASEGQATAPSATLVRSSMSRRRVLPALHRDSGGSGPTLLSAGVPRSWSASSTNCSARALTSPSRRKSTSCGARRPWEYRWPPHRRPSSTIRTAGATA